MLYTLKTTLNTFVLAAFLFPLIAIPVNANALVGGLTNCGIAGIFAIIGGEKGEAKKVVFMKAAVAARKAAFATHVPVADSGALGFETGSPPEDQAQNTGSFWANLWQNGKEACLDKLAADIAKIIIRQMRNMVINWVNTGNIGGTPTFVTNFEFDAKQTASNAARLFASKAAGIDFCNYFPYNPAVNLDFRADLRIALECNVNKTFDQHVQGIAQPSSRTPIDDVLSMYSDRDPLKTEFLLREAQASEVASAQKARETQVVSGQGFTGVERCKRYENFSEGRYIHLASGEVWTPPNDGSEFVSPPAGVEYQPAIKYCAEKETVTPGHVSAELISGAIDSEFREGDLVDEFGEAIGAIVDAMVGKLINEGLTKAGL